VKREKSSRPKLPKVSEEMKAWSAALAVEVSDWPEVATRSFFGFTALYRNDKMFAILPRTRGMESPNALAFRIDTPSAANRAHIEKDPRVGSAEIKKPRWFTLELSSDTDLHDALDWLGRAYDAAAKSKKSG
jgi:TfoX/Sxy family transcriptional regulator of competence genes